MRKGLELRSDEVVLRMLRRSDGPAWREVRETNRDWLRPWEGTSPDGHKPETSFGTMLRTVNAEMAAGRTVSFAIEYQGRYAGTLTIGNIIRGSLQAAYIGYWIDHRVAGRGIMPTAVAMALDFGLGELGLHRIEISIRPENAPSLRVVEKLRLPLEGRRPRYLHIAGDWRDHNIYVAYQDTAPCGGFLARWLRERSLESR
ncbi:MAG: GNAT family N-acetyltransferase [Candidatus Nanopelagicales bacterium]